MKVVTRYIDEEKYFAKLNQLGIPANLTRYNDEGEEAPVKLENQVGDCVSPSLLCANGDMVRTVELNEEQAGLLPMVIEEPFFVVDYRDDEYEIVGEGEEAYEQLMDWPKYLKNSSTEEDPTRTIMQPAGIIL